MSRSSAEIWSSSTKDEQIAGVGEVDLRGKERRRRHALAALLGEIGQRRGEQVPPTQ